MRILETKEQILEEEIRELERVVKDKVKGIQQGERKSTLLEAGLLSLQKQLEEVEKELGELVEERREVSSQTCVLCHFVV